MPDYRPYHSHKVHGLYYDTTHDGMLKSLELVQTRIPDNRVVISSFYSLIPWIKDKDGVLLFEYRGRYYDLYVEYGMEMELCRSVHNGGVYHHLILVYPDVETRFKMKLSHGVDIEADIEQSFVKFSYDGLLGAY